ncbi:MAG: marine proteobacterial sortase target protein [Pseudomonadota bacterium]|nr:MAG: marine proteobacterial sortase target protein [Pseudomonadota bacterium]
MRSFMFCLFITSSAMALSQPAPASDSSALWLHTAEESAAVEALALSTDVTIEVTGSVANAEVTQRFFNDSGHWAEGRYRFPLPDGSAVERLEILVDDRLIAGEIRERESARSTYQRARDAGQAAGLVEQSGGNLFTTHIANIPPGQAVEVRIGFSLAVEYRLGEFRLHFPTTAAPRFRHHDGSRAAVDAELNRMTTPTGTAGLPQRPYALLVDLRPGIALSDVSSSHHDIRVEQIGSDWLIELADGVDFSGRDFELVWRPENQRHASQAAFAEHANGHEHLLLTLVPPPAFDAADTAREVILIMDTSGSMQGEPIEQAREALLYALASLSTGDRFNVIRFSNAAETLYRQPVAFSERHLIEASQWVSALQAGGGTNILSPLAHALARPPQDGFLRQVIFVTDGIVDNERDVLELADRDRGESRLFAVGIGHGVNATFLRRLGEVGRGSYTGIAVIGQIVDRMSELIVQLESPVIHDLELYWPGQATVYPERLPDLYVGQPLTVVARLPQLAGDLVLRGISNGRPFEQVMALEAFRPAAGVAAQWGRARIEALERTRGQGADPDRVAQSILDTALDYGLVSSRTSLVAVDRTPARSRSAALARFGLETSPAAGRGPMRAMPSTDAGSFERLVRGGVALLLVLLLLTHRRWLSGSGDSA